MKKVELKGLLRRPEWLAAASLVVTACSGGGGSSSPPPPPPPPPPPNAAPNLVVEVPEDLVDEGQPFTLDISGSTDPDGDALSFSVSQTSGPTATANPPGYAAPTVAGVFLFAAPEVDADSEMTFELSASDGEDTSSQSVTVTAANISFSPEVSLFSEPVAVFEGLNSPQAAAFLSASYGDPFIGIVGVQDAENGTGLEVFQFKLVLADGNFEPMGTASLPMTNAGSTATIDTGGFSQIAPQAIITVEEDDRFFVFPDGISGAGAGAPGNYATTAPCAAQGTNSSPYDDIAIGSRGNGVQFWDNSWDILTDPITLPGEFSPGRILEPLGDFCALVSTGFDLFGFNADQDVLNRWFPYGTFRASYDVDIPDGLSVVDMAATSSASGFFAVALLMTDGEHDGVHQVLVLSTDIYAGEPVATQLLDLPKGVPLSITMGDFGSESDFAQEVDLFVALSSAPYGVVFVNQLDQIAGDTHLSYAEPQYVPIPLGISGARFGTQTDLTGRSIVFTLTDQGRVEMRDLELP